MMTLAGSRESFGFAACTRADVTLRCHPQGQTTPPWRLVSEMRSCKRSIARVGSTSFRRGKHRPKRPPKTRSRGSGCLERTYSGECPVEPTSVRPQTNFAIVILTFGLRALLFAIVATRPGAVVCSMELWCAFSTIQNATLAANAQEADERRIRAVRQDLVAGGRNHHPPPVQHELNT